MPDPRSLATAATLRRDPSARLPMDSRYPELDGLRGLAALAVVIFHAKMRWLPFGWAAVDLFFVLSGYLITAIILRHGGSRGFLKSFYLRRGLRVWPLYFLVVGLVVATAPWHRNPPNWAGLSYTLTFTQSVPLYWNGYAPALSPSMLHAWTLALEEQFYLLWPALVLLLGRRSIVPLSLSCVVVSFATRAQGWNFTLLAARSDGLALGALLAAILAGGIPTGRPRTFLRMGLGTSLLVGLALIIALGGLTRKPEDSGPALTILGYNLLFLGIVGLSVIESGHPALGLLRHGGVRWLGQISYGLYLIHHPIFVVVRAIAREHGIIDAPRWLFGPTILGCIALAAFSYHFFEAPILILKDRFAYQRDPGARPHIGAPSDAGVRAQ